MVYIYAHILYGNQLTQTETVIWCVTRQCQQLNDSD